MGNFRFGFELEGFYSVNNTITLPPKGYPTDGFPGLCEVRSSGGKSLWDAHTQLLGEYNRNPFDYETVEYTFSPDDKRQIRARNGEKTAVSIQNVYGKKPKALGNRTLASLQINISLLTDSSYTDKEGRYHPERYGLFDYVPIIRALDNTFKEQIEDAGRQIGWYAVKDGYRVEYRSLPNKVFSIYPHRIKDLLDRIEKAVNNA